MFWTIAFLIAVTFCQSRKNNHQPIAFPVVGCFLVVTILTLTSCNSSETMKEYYDTGELKYEYSVSNGKREGKYKMYYKDGTTMRYGQFREGLLDGWNSFYCTNGQLC